MVTKAVEEGAVVKLAMDKATVAKAAADKVTTKKVPVNKAATTKAAANKVVAVKVATNKAVVTKATEEAVAKAVADATALKTTYQGAVATKTTMGSVGSGSSAAPVVELKRAVALGGGTTPCSKHFHCAWKPWYVGQLCSRLLFHLFVLYLIEPFIDQHACHWCNGV
jgi:hypothetical protein